MSELETSVPAYYIVAKSLDDPQIEFIQHALRITPISAAIITDVYDQELAAKLSDVVCQASSLLSAHEIAQQVYKETGQSVIIIADTQLIDGYDSEGKASKNEG